MVHSKATNLVHTHSLLTYQGIHPLPGGAALLTCLAAPMPVTQLSKVHHSLLQGPQGVHHLTASLTPLMQTTPRSCLVSAQAPHGPSRPPPTPLQHMCLTPVHLQAGKVTGQPSHYIANSACGPTSHHCQTSMSWTAPSPARALKKMPRSLEHPQARFPIQPLQGSPATLRLPGKRKLCRGSSVSRA